MKKYIMKHYLIFSTLFVFFVLFTWLFIYLLTVPFFREISYPTFPVKDMLLIIVSIVVSIVFIYFIPIIIIVEIVHPLWIPTPINIEYPKRIYWIPKHENVRIVTHKRLLVFLC